MPPRIMDHEDELFFAADGLLLDDRPARIPRRPNFLNFNLLEDEEDLPSDSDSDENEDEEIQPIGALPQQQIPLIQFPPAPEQHPVHPENRVTKFFLFPFRKTK